MLTVHVTRSMAELWAVTESSKFVGTATDASLCLSTGCGGSVQLLLLHKQDMGRCLLLLCLLAACITLSQQAPAPRDSHHDEDLVPGWMGSDYQPPQPVLLEHRMRRMKVLDADARIFLFEGFLTPEECDYIINKATPRLRRSQVVSSEKSDSINRTVEEQSDIRTSEGMFFERGEDDMIKSVEERIAAWTLLPVHNGEGLQVLRYGPGQKYDAHWDYFFHKEGVNNGGNRYATVLTYLNDVEEGGETTFPLIPAPGGENKGFSECARKHLAVKPRKGDAVLFHSIAPSGAMERRSFHAACPVLKGVKWSMPKWIHVGRYATAGEQAQVVEQSIQLVPKHPGECEDLNDNCDAWSVTGECDKNPGYMIGTTAQPGACLKACNRCDILAAFKKQQQQPEATAEQRRLNRRLSH